MIYVICALLFVVSVFDVLTTEYALRNGAREANPLARWMFERFDRPFVYTLKLILTVVVIWLLVASNADIAILLGFAMTVGIGIVSYRNYRNGAKIAEARRQQLGEDHTSSIV